MLNTHKSGLAAALVASFALYACGGGSSGGSDSSSAATTTTTTSSTASSNSSSVTSSTSSSASSTASSSAASSTSAASGSVSNTAVGWANYYSSSSSSLTGGTGGTTYTVSTRAGLIQALYDGKATINSDGSYSGTLDSSSKRIIYVSGTISLNQNGAGTELTANDYVANSCAYSTYSYASADAMWSAYYAAFNPGTWAAGSSAATPSGNPESARACAAALQKKIVMLYVPSNTSIIGVGSDAKITHGNLVLGTSSAAVDNIIIRNINFQDAFDFFPQWDPTDSTTGRWNSAYDLVSVMYATHVWVDHNEFSDGSRTDDLYPSVWSSSNSTVTTASDGTDYTSNEVYKFMHHDGMVDVTKSASLVTLSYNYFHDHDKSFLIGGTDTASASAEHPGVLNVTFHHNYFKNLKQRQPRVRYGMVHVYDNYYENTLDSTGVYGWAVAWTVGQGGKIYAENNAITVPTSYTVSNVYGFSLSASKLTSCASLYSTADCSAYFYDSNTLLNGSTVDVTSAIYAASYAKSTSAYVSTTAIWKPSTYYSYTLDSASTLSSTIPSSVGVGKL